jgi:Ca2+-binding EF-hand superfamily protein
MQELRDGIAQLGMRDANSDELERAFRCFDRDRSGKITVDELMRGLRVRLLDGLTGMERSSRLTLRL